MWDGHCGKRLFKKTHQRRGGGETSWYSGISTETETEKPGFCQWLVRVLWRNRANRTCIGDYGRVRVLWRNRTNRTCIGDYGGGVLHLLSTSLRSRGVRGVVWRAESWRADCVYSSLGLKALEPGELRAGEDPCPSSNSQAESKFNILLPFCSTEALIWLDDNPPP